MRKFSLAALALAAFATPLLVSAQTGINIAAITPYSNGIKGVINGILVPVLIAVAFIVFLLGIYKYFILGAANESEKGEGRKFAMWGVIGFVVIFSLWGLVNVGLNLFPGLRGQNAPPSPVFSPGTAGGTNASSNNSFLNNNSTSNTHTSTVGDGQWSHPCGPNSTCTPGLGLVCVSNICSCAGGGTACAGATGGSGGTGGSNQTTQSSYDSCMNQYENSAYCSCLDQNNPETYCAGEYPNN